MNSIVTGPYQLTRDDSLYIFQSLAKHTRQAMNTVEGGPPAFVPFGQRVKSVQNDDKKPQKGK